MKKYCKCHVIALYELKSQWRGFTLFFLISLILISSLISIFSLTVHIPDEMTDYIRSTGKGAIYIEPNINDMEEIEALDIEVSKYVFPHLGPSAIIIPKELDYNVWLEDDTVFSFGGYVLRWLPNENYTHIKWLNDGIVSGRGLEEQDNYRPVIWISDETAKVLNVSCGDTIDFKATSVSATSVPCEIVGIYTQKATLPGFYVSMSLYSSSLDSLKQIPMFVTPNQLNNYKNIVADLEKYCTDVKYSEEFINSVMIMIYALYSICVLICVLETSMILSMSKSYFHKRNHFFAINKALGMKNSSILYTICMVMQGLIILAFICAMFISPIIMKYIIDLLEELFSGVKIPTNIWTPLSFSLLVIISILLWIICIICQKSYRSLHIISLIKRGNE